LAPEPLPKDVKAVVCAINGTRTKVAPDEPIDPICKASDASQLSPAAQFPKLFSEE
jgi:hypothetical protein